MDQPTSPEFYERARRSLSALATVVVVGIMVPSTTSPWFAAVWGVAMAWPLLRIARDFENARGWLTAAAGLNAAFTTLAVTDALIDDRFVTRGLLAVVPLAGLCLVVGLCRWCVAQDWAPITRLWRRATIWTGVAVSAWLTTIVPFARFGSSDGGFRVLTAEFEMPSGHWTITVWIVLCSVIAFVSCWKIAGALWATRRCLEEAAEHYRRQLDPAVA